MGEGKLFGKRGHAPEPFLAPTPIKTSGAKIRPVFFADYGSVNSWPVDVAPRYRACAYCGSGYPIKDAPRNCYNCGAPTS
jgi:hypothetical protein